MRSLENFSDDDDEIIEGELLDDRPRRRPPATTPEGRENQMVNLAFDQAELMLREGRAPTPVVVHYLKLGTENAKLEREKLRSAIALDHRKAENLETASQLEAMYEDAKSAMLHYQGRPDLADDQDDLEYYD